MQELGRTRGTVLVKWQLYDYCTYLANWIREIEKIIDSGFLVPAHFQIA
jgi:hypothetical protein